MSSALDKARAGTARLRNKYRSAQPIRTLSAFGGGALVGALERANVMPPALLGIPLKPILSLGAHIVGANSTAGGMVNSIGHGMGDGIAGAYGYAAGKAGTLIAGEDSEDGQLQLSGGEAQAA